LAFGYCAITLLEIDTHDARGQRSAAFRLVVPLSRTDLGILQRADERLKPARLQDDVLIDLADDRMTRGSHSEIDSRCGAATLAGDDAQRAATRIFADQSGGAIAAPVVDDDHFQGPPVGLAEDRVERVDEASNAVVHRNHEADALHQSAAFISRYNR